MRKEVGKPVYKGKEPAIFAPNINPVGQHGEAFNSIMGFRKNVKQTPGVIRSVRNTIGRWILVVRNPNLELPTGLEHPGGLLEKVFGGIHVLEPILAQNVVHTVRIEEVPRLTEIGDGIEAKVYRIDVQPDVEIFRTAAQMYFHNLHFV